MANLPPAPPAATLSIHRDFLERSSPAWLVGATSSRREQFRAATAQPPDWYQRASPTQQKTLNARYTASFTAQTALDKAMAPLQDIDTFAHPLLVKALQEQFNVQLDVNKILVQLRTRVEYLQPQATYGSFEVLRLPLLQAALHNFEASECEEGAFDASSGFVRETADVEKFEAVNTSLTVVQFTGLCRSLDIGAQYQCYLKDFLSPKDPVADQVLRQKFSAARKADLAAAAEQALLTQDIGPDDYRMIVSVINGENHPWMGTRQVWFRDLGLMKKRMTGCVAFVICEIRRYTNDLILYIPQDPHHPLKRVTYDQMRSIFKERFTTRDTSVPDDGRPTAYQDFFSRFVRYGDLPTYFGALTTVTPAAGALVGLKLYSPFLIHFLRGISPFKTFEAASNPEPIKRLNPDPFLDVATKNQKGRIGWEDNLDLWNYLYEQHRDKLLADAASHAVPTADVDARVRSEKIAKLLGIGFLALNVVSMFVPVLGEVMMGVMAGQLLYETLEGSIEWAEGDRRAAKAHLVDAAENLAFLALMAGGAKVIGKLTAAKPAPVIEALDPVTLPSGETRLWKPDLKGYESPVSLPADAAPNAQGQYLHEGKTYIRQSGKVYEKTFDKTLNRWRITHPTDPAAYQPPLSHNGAGAWRHTLEQPLRWDRLTLMQRMGPVTEGFDELQLLQIADISGVSDNALRKMHLDNAPPPAPLADTLRLFKADMDVAQVIEQVSSGQAVDGRYMYALPLVTELPRWPVGRVLEVFDDPALTGPSVRYGTERLFHGVKLKPPIRISRADVVTSRLPSHIIAALEESEITGLLGGEAARVRENRPVELRKQLADFARTRQPALFESLYKGTGVPDPTVAKLQRLYPGLSEPAAKSVVAEADAEQLSRLHHTGRVPLAMQEHARLQVRQGRVSRAYAGLHMENMASADSKRLALHTLSKLPGWSDQVRLEVREGSIEGTVLDSIGSETASQRKYLVKKGPLYQAFNERGEELNSLPRHGDNFYASLMHALPDEARRGLGLPHVSQNAQLRRAIIDYVNDHPRASAQSVEGRTRQRPWFKPPQRISAKLVGYPASGSGEGRVDGLATRAQAIYPDMSPVQANEWVLAFMREGKNDDQILTLLENRRREWETLDTTLTTWAGTEAQDPMIRQHPALDPRPRMAAALRRSWQKAPLLESPGHAELVLNGDVTLPSLEANFSHVRSLTMRGRRLVGSDLRPVLAYFPELQRLTLAGADMPLHSVPEGLESLRALTSLHIESMADLTALEQTRLEGLTQLQQLNLNYPYQLHRPLDVSRMSDLRSLTLSGSGLRDFPVGIFDLPNVQRLDFKRSGISELPSQLFEPGREHLWSSLSLDWSRFSRERFKAAYDYVESRPGHVMDQTEMVRDYCTGQFINHLGRPAATSPAAAVVLNAAFVARWPSAQAQFDAMEALSTEYADLAQGLEAWVNQPPELLERSNRATIDYALRGSWYHGVWARYGFNRPTPLSLPGMSVSELPRLTGEGFAHVTELRVPNATVPCAQLGAFIRGFSSLRTLDASNCGLTELVLPPGAWPALEHLDLSKNPLASLDVSGLNPLQSLSLRGSTLPTWPTGAEHLAELTWLDLRDTAIAKLPESALAEDRLLLNINLAGAQLTPEAQAAVAAARQRVERKLGLSDGALSLFEQLPTGNAFPPSESGTELTHQLLPLLAPKPVEGTLTLAQQLQRLHPALGAEDAGQWLERLHGEGLNDLQVAERISGWEQTADALTRRLNSWVFRRTFDFGHDRVVTPNTRQIAGEYLLASWREGVSNVASGAGRELNFHGMILGDLPELATTFDKVETLNLNGVQLSGQGSNGFLRAFPNLKTLVLSSNPLVEVPDALASMSGLERLELSAVGISDPELIYSTLGNLQGLRWLDLSYCDLESFQLTRFDDLQTLNLNNNELAHWPQGALQSTALRTLDLSSNQIESIPPLALEGAHDSLMAGVNLSDNFNLSLDDLYRLQDYAERTGSNRALHLSSNDIQQLINDLEHPAISDSESAGEGLPDLAPVEPDEVLEGTYTAGVYRDPWLQNLSLDEQAHHTQLWRQLASEPDNAQFFNLLYLLQGARDFQLSRATLTHRVWEVMEAAAGDAELRETLFAASATHGTCPDGRALTFSGLEVKVHEVNTLRDIDPANLERKGSALWELSLDLFYRDQVEVLAGKHTAGRDAAEIRLKYLIGLKNRLKLPGVPDRMIFDTPISGEPMEREAAAIEALVKTDAFYQNLISRDYWVSYLSEQYPEDFAALARRRAEQLQAFGEAHPDPAAEGYAAQSAEMEYELQVDQTNTWITLSKRAETDLNLVVPDRRLPGTSARLMGAPTR